MIKDCPVCGKLAIRFHKGYSKKEKVSCINPDCPIKDIKMNYKDWQNRPRDNEYERKITDLESQIRDIQNIYCSKDGEYPTTNKYNNIGSMVLFQIEGEIYIGGYVSKTNTWFTQNEEEFDNEDYIVYWKYLENLELKYKNKKEISNEGNYINRK